MKYELAKDLKNAGFPFEWNYDPNALAFIQYPTLSELIKACNQCISHIKRVRVNNIDYWWAVSRCGHLEHEPEGKNINLERIGSTPEIAVAKLWLALNKKA